MASATAATPTGQARLKPLDNAEQEYVLRQRLSHPLSHRPIVSLRPKLSALAASRAELGDPSSSTSADLASNITLQSSSLLGELQSYLLSLTRTSQSSDTTTAAQIAEYEEQLAQIKAEEQASQNRIATLKKQLEEVRRRRREKIEYGRVAESIERWFKTGSADVAGASSSQSTTVEIEDSLSTLVSHLTSSFLYKPDGHKDAKEDQDMTDTASGTQPNHSQTLTLLHSKLDEMLNLSRQVREIVGWKAGTAVSGNSANAAGASVGGGGAHSRRDQANEDAAGAAGGQSGSGSSTPIASRNPLNANAKPFQPVTTGASSKRSRAGTGLTNDLEEGETFSSVDTDPAKKRRTQQQSVSAGDEDEEGSIPSAAAAAAPIGGNRRGRGAAAAAAAANSSGGGGTSIRGRGRGSGPRGGGMASQGSWD